LTTLKKCDILLSYGRESWCVMLREPKYKFNIEKKEEFFGRNKMVDVAEKMEMTNVYLSYLINNKFPFNEYVAKTLMLAVGFSKGDV